MEFDRLVVGFLVDEVVGGFFISVPPGHVACVYDRGRGVLPRIWGPGLHLKIPFWQVAKLFNAQILEYTMRHGFELRADNKEELGDEPVTTQTKDGHVIAVEGSVLFKIDRQNAPTLWENIGESFVSKVVRPIARSRISAVFSELKIGDIGARTQIEQAIREELNQHFQVKGLVCEGFLLSQVKVLNPQGRDDILIQEETNIIHG